MAILKVFCIFASMLKKSKILLDSCVQYTDVMKRNFEYSACFEIEILMFSNQHPSMQLLEAPKHWKKCILVMDWPRNLHWFCLKYFINIELSCQIDYYYLFYFFTKPINKPFVLCKNHAIEEVRLYSTIYIWRQQIVAKQ